MEYFKDKKMFVICLIAFERDFDKINNAILCLKNSGPDSHLTINDSCGSILLDRGSYTSNGPDVWKQIGYRMAVCLYNIS